MDHNTQMIVFLFCLMGCSLLLVNAAECNQDEVSKCMGGIANPTKEDPCDGKMAEAVACMDKLGCELSQGVKQSVAAARQSVQGCENKEETDKPSTTAAPPSTSCDDQAVQKCNMDHEKAYKGGDAQCSDLGKVIECFASITANCMNKTLDATLKEQHAALKKNETDLKCCSVPVLNKCMEPVKSNQYQIVNETVNKEICKVVSSVKLCMDKELNACNDTAVKTDFEMSTSEMNKNFVLCEEKGFLGSGTTIQPALALLLAACLVTMSRFV